MRHVRGQRRPRSGPGRPASVPSPPGWEVSPAVEFPSKERPGSSQSWPLHRDSQLHSQRGLVCSRCPRRALTRQASGKGEVMELIAGDHPRGLDQALSAEVRDPSEQARPPIGRLGVAVRRKAVTAGSVAADRRGMAASFRCPRARRCGNARRNRPAGRIAPSHG